MGMTTAVNAYMYPQICVAYTAAVFSCTVTGTDHPEVP